MKVSSKQNEESLKVKAGGRHSHHCDSIGYERQKTFIFVYTDANSSSHATAS
jgi:hypothetical protein